MKKIQFLLPIAILALATGCNEKEPTDKDILDGRTVTPISVSYEVAGAPATDMDLPHQSSKGTVQVVLNDENLCWTLESDSPWCRVVSTGMQGPGEAVIEVDSNGSFDAREAKLTFKAGVYTGPTFTVNQQETAFIINIPYLVAPLAGGTYPVEVQTKEGVTYNWSGEWISAADGGSVTAEGVTTTTLQLTVAANERATRLGKLTLSASGNTEDIWVAQFGTDLSYDADGNLFFPSDQPAVLSLTAPEFMVRKVTVENGYGNGTVTDNGDGTSTIVITLTENLSDCAEMRTVAASLLLGNTNLVALPVMIQDYIPAHGLVTAKSLVAFAKAWADGGDISDWQKDGVVNMAQDIDMDGVTGWAGIGTPERPFTGAFDGKGHVITNLKNTASGLFNVCEEAEVSNVGLGKGCSIYMKEDGVTEDQYFGGIATKAIGSTFTNCSMGGNLEFSSGSDDEVAFYVGGIVGWMDEMSTLTGCRTAGNIQIATVSGGDATLYLGGVAGKVDGALISCGATGEFNVGSPIPHLRLGGVAAILEESAEVSSNDFSGKINISGTATDIVAGGLYATLEGSRTFNNADDKSVPGGEINLQNFKNSTSGTIYLGGFVGLAPAGKDITFTGSYTSRTNFYANLGRKIELSYFCVGGFLGGCDANGAIGKATFDGVTYSGSYIQKLYRTSGSETVNVVQISRGFYGGIAGFINGNADFNGCISTGTLYGLADSGLMTNTKNYLEVSGGIAAMVVGGDATFTDCTNSGPIANWHFSNSVPAAIRDNWYVPCIAAGILGAFDYKPVSTGGTLTMTGCTNSGQILAYRGIGGGILGYARNATITSCTNTGTMNVTNGTSAIKGGIAAWLTQSTLSLCTARCDIYVEAPGGAAQNVGGIVAIANAEVSVNGCKWFGNITQKNGTAQALGGIVGSAMEDTLVSQCRFGGTILAVPITENNVKAYAVGNNAVENPEVTFWNGD